MMKRILIVLAALLLLSGCSGENEDTQQTTAGVITPTEQGIYLQDNALEQQTGGAVRTYELPEEDLLWISLVGDKLLFATKTDTTALTVMTGADCVPTAIRKLDENAVACQTTFNGVCYYQKDTGEAVCLDQQLQEISRIKLPENMEGMPIFAQDGSEIYFCQGKEIMAYDTTLNIVRPVKSQSCKSMQLQASYFGGKVISCQVTYEDGTQSLVYLSTQTGETLSADQALQWLDTNADKFVAQHLDGSVRQLIFGTLEGNIENLNLPQDKVIAPAVGTNGVIAYTTDEAQTLHLEFYDLTTGKQTTAVSIPNGYTPKTILADRWSHSVWVLTQDSQAGTYYLFRWDLSKNPVQDEMAYKTPVFTKEAVDEEGLKACQKRAKEISSEHQVDIRIWENAVKVTGEYTLEPEYQTVAINRALDELEAVFSLFPEKFLYKSVNRQVRVCIVRSVDGDTAGVQFWQSSEAYIAICPGSDIRDTFMQTFAYVVNSHALGSSVLLDNWAELNPEGFVYGETKDEKYLTGETRAFVDEVAMTNVTEDRSRLFWQATKENNAELFQSAAMQNKLRQLCLGIRDGWRLEKKEESFLWEQYLAEPVAYKG